VREGRTRRFRIPVPGRFSTDNRITVPAMAGSDDRDVRSLGRHCSAVIPLPRLAEMPGRHRGRTRPFSSHLARLVGSRRRKTRTGTKLVRACVAGASGCLPRIEEPDLRVTGGLPASAKVDPSPTSIRIRDAAEEPMLGIEALGPVRGCSSRAFSTSSATHSAGEEPFSGWRAWGGWPRRPGCRGQSWSARPRAVRISSTNRVPMRGGAIAVR
jgi:hypothetical protein